MSRYPRVVISLETQRRIKEMARQGIYYRDIAMDFGLNPRAVSRVLDGSYVAPAEPLSLETGCGKLSCDDKIRRLRSRLAESDKKKLELQARLDAVTSSDNSDLVDTLEYLKRGIEKLIAERKT